MNETTETLIIELAEKFGTTAELLWGSLLRQAPISSGIEALLLCGAWGAMVWGAIWIRRTHPDDVMPGEVWLTLWAIAAAFLVPVTMICLPTIVAGFANPEYWALKQLLPLLK